METISVPLEADAADRLKRAAAEIGMPLEEFIASAAEQFVTNIENASATLSADQKASIERGLQDVAEGRTFSHDDVFTELKARFNR
jgi:predicted transcriptional regulator